MMKKLGVAAAAIAMTVAGSAQAAEWTKDVYVRLDTGWGFASDAGIKQTGGDDTINDIGNSPLFGLGVGYRINPMFRTDLTFTYRGSYAIDDKVNGTTYDGDIESYATMLNGYFDIPVDLGRFKPYVGFGIGWAHNEQDNQGATVGGVKDTAPSGSSDTFAWQAMLGTGVVLTESLTLDAGYRYFDGGELKWDAGRTKNGNTYNGGDGDLKAHEVTVSLRYGF